MALMRRLPLAAALALGCAGPGLLGPPVSVVLLGDSTTAGTPYFRSPLEWPPTGAGNPLAQYGHWIRREHPGWAIANRGVAGETTEQILARLRRDALDGKAGFVLILAGVNDVYQGISPERTQENLLRMYREAKAAAVVPIAATVLPFDRATPAQREALRALNAWLAEAAAREGVAVCDLNRAARRPGDWDLLLGSDDGLHPDLATYRRVGEAAAACLESAAGDKRRPRT